MNIRLLVAIIAITLALVFYTIGVFSERHAHSLKKWHVVTFWLGLICDTTGTLTMSTIAKTNGSGMESGSLSIHGVTGAIAILLMIFHAVWATYTLVKGDDKKKLTFHKFSLFVWLVWLIPYILGMVMGMSN